MNGVQSKLPVITNRRSQYKCRIRLTAMCSIGNGQPCIFIRFTIQHMVWNRRARLQAKLVGHKSTVQHQS